jgi:hypothetical protein
MDDKRLAKIAKNGKPPGRLQNVDVKKLDIDLIRE